MLTVLADPTDKNCCLDVAGNQRVWLGGGGGYRFVYLHSLRDNLRGSMLFLSCYQTPNLSVGEGMAMQETWVGKIPWRRKQQPTPVFLPGESHG